MSEDALHQRIAELTALVLLLAERLCVCSELLGRCAERRGAK